MPSFIDQTGRTIELDYIPNRIISLVPSQTELLHDLGLSDEVVGITKFCIHPDKWFNAKTKVGGTKNINIDAIHSLKPDLIIANKEENLKSDIEILMQHYPVWISDIISLEDNNDMILKIGTLTSTKIKAKEIVTNIQQNFNNLNTDNRKIKTAYLIWQNPFMVAGSDTFINTMMQAAGFENIFLDKKRYPEINIEEIKMNKCELIILSSEPYPFKEKHLEAFQKLLPEVKIILADGELFSWYGSRIMQAPAYFSKIRNKVLSY